MLKHLITSWYSKNLNFEHLKYEKSFRGEIKNFTLFHYCSLLDKQKKN